METNIGYTPDMPPDNSEQGIELKLYNPNNEEDDISNGDLGEYIEPENSIKGSNDHSVVVETKTEKETPNGEVSGEKRDTWGNKAEFLLASIGLAVGLGNVWRFPYLCQRNGGGAFLIPYVIFMFIEGIPLMLLEFAIGQKMRGTAVRIWKDIHPALFGVGIGCLMVSLLLCMYYVIVIAWCLLYLFISMTKNLPWASEEVCSKNTEYNTLKDTRDYWKNNYTSSALNATFRNNSQAMYMIAKQKVDNFSDCCVIDPPQWYFYTEVLDISTEIEDYGDGLNGKLVGCLILAWVIVYLCVVKGIKSSGKVVYFTATFPYIILIVLLIRGVTLDGARNGLETFITPDWERLKDVKVWKDAATQMFFTLSLAFGALTAFASYMPYNNQCIHDGYTVVIINCATSMFAGVVVFSILGYRELKTGIAASEVGSGPGLAFMAFSDALLNLDVSPLWAILFFIMLILLGIDSEFGTLEAVIGPLMELGTFPKKMRKEVVTAIVAIVLLLVGLGMVAGNGFYIFQIFDDYAAGIALLVIAMFQCIGVAWIYGNERFADDIEDMTGSRPWIGWRICWKYISPIALFLILVATVYDLTEDTATYQAFVGCEQDPFSSKYLGSKTWTAGLEYPGWGQFLCALMVLIPTAPIIFFIIYRSGV
ncbi:sodium-dependent neutral amino acid transporter B(0)AT1-like isoform X2 [Paramuricea clavata]|uniref:Transporter n=1 Tax=Paramuricea clavata TaxID=317549 RepID=A0A7D9ETJ0_PARCT|nr:sodium-dependent neutral amino acid transporter B(0)AT1-like isoform X2 [Paramuricea clavata]